MNNTEKNMELFQELLLCSYQLYLWTYDPEFHIVKTNCPPDLFTGDAVQVPTFAETIRHFLNSDGHHPLLLDSALGMYWIADFEWEENQLRYIHLIGPAYTGKNSQQLLRMELDKRNLTVRFRSRIFQQINEVPIIPSNLMYQYAVMFHYCITGERISSSQLCFPQHIELDVPAPSSIITDEHFGIWSNEQKLLKMIREGDPDYLQALERCSTLSYGIRFEIGDTIRQQKDSLIVLLTLVSRAAIEGGLSPMISYSLNDIYAKKIEDCSTISALSNTGKQLLEDYVQGVRKAKQNQNTSSVIRSSCDYIDLHLTEPLSIAALARQSGYSEYYYSYKFKKETGCSVSEYIKKARIEHAKYLLASSRMSIQTICEELDFGSRSHFTSTFTKLTGISPTEYRKQHFKN